MRPTRSVFCRRTGSRFRASSSAFTGNTELGTAFRKPTDVWRFLGNQKVPQGVLYWQNKFVMRPLATKPQNCRQAATNSYANVHQDGGLCLFSMERQRPAISSEEPSDV